MRRLGGCAAGKYRHKVTIRNSTLTDNAMNEEVRTPSVYTTTRVRLKTQGAREVVAANQTQGERTHRFFARSNKKNRAITPKMTLLFEGRNLEIVGSWDIDGMREEVVIDCKEAV